MKKRLQEIYLATGDGVSVALLDSGLNPGYPLLSKQNLEIFDVSLAKNQITLEKLSPRLITDLSGHGSAVQSCLYMAAPDCQVTHYRLLDENSQTSSTKLCLALEHVLQQNHKIVQLSLGTRNEETIPWLASIMRKAYEKNIAIVAAASNIGSAVYPARLTYCISVGVGNFLDIRHLEFVERDVIEFRACGINVAIPLPEGKFAHVTGASYAASFVTGLCARMLERNPKFTPWDLKVTLREFAKSTAETLGQAN